MAYRIEISLYYDDHVYETEEEYAFIEDNKICFYEATSEKHPVKDMPSNTR